MPRRSWCYGPQRDGDLSEQTGFGPRGILNIRLRDFRAIGSTTDIVAHSCQSNSLKLRPLKVKPSFPGV
jgi:hypothetical protein